MKKELIVALANSIVKEMLEMWFTNIKKRVGISNYLVVALDDNIEKFCKSNDVPVYCRDHDDGIERCDATGHREQSRMVCFRPCLGPRREKREKIPPNASRRTRVRRPPTTQNAAKRTTRARIAKAASEPLRRISAARFSPTVPNRAICTYCHVDLLAVALPIAFLSAIRCPTIR